MAAGIVALLVIYVLEYIVHYEHKSCVCTKLELKQSFSKNYSAAGASPKTPISEAFFL